MRSLKDVYPEFADNLDFYAVNIDPTDDLARLEEFGQNQEYPWPMANSDKDTLSSLDVTYQSTKIAIDENGVIIYRERMGGGDPDTWREVFEKLSDA